MRDFGGPAKAGIAAARAGVDLLLFTDLGPPLQAQRALVCRPALQAACRAGAFEASAQRVLELRGRAGPR